jgi:hypothetical protein
LRKRIKKEESVERRKGSERTITVYEKADLKGLGHEIEFKYFDKNI